MANASVPSPPLRSLSRRRQIAYAAILTVVVFTFVAGALELALRVVGYGHSTHFARREKLPDGSVIWRENRDFTAPFFPPHLIRRPQPFRLPEKKAPGTIRIFVLGSSAAMGDPEASFSIARLLEAQLRAAYPKNHFEVINAAITAVNSHVVRRIAEDCARLEPDLFIVYEGHNEVIGPFGPTGVFTGFLRSEHAVRFAVWLKSTRIGQLVSALSQRPRDNDTWRGMEMFLAHQIAADDPRLDSVRAHFAANLRAIVRAADRAGAATLLCTPLANQRDFAPFLSLHRPHLDAAQLVEWEKAYASGNDALAAGDSSRAEASYRAALAIDDRHAETHFRLARALLAGDPQHPDARTHFQRALDLDALRFRADSSLNNIIRALPSSLPRSRVRVVDLDSALTAPARLGFPAGNRLFYEHVHFAFPGAAAVVEELFPAIVSELSLRGLPAPASSSAPLSAADLRQRLAFTAYEQAMIFLELQDRYQRPPFTAQSDQAFRLETTARQLTRARELLARPDATDALRTAYDHALAQAPNDWVLLRNAGMMLAARERPAEALPLLERAVAWIDDDVDTLLSLDRVHRALGNSDAASRFREHARKLEPRHPAFRE
jgi:hypothetical protein